MAAPATVTVFDDVFNTAGVAVANSKVNCILQFTESTVATSGSIVPLQQSTVTDQNGHYTFILVPNVNINPTGTTYLISTEWNTYEIAIPSGAGPFRVTDPSVLVNQPGTLSPAVTGLTGPITVTGNLAVTANETVGGTLGVTGGTTLAGLTAGVSSLGATSIGGDLTILSAFRLLFGAVASKIIPGATSLSLRNHADSADNVLITDAGAATIRNGLTVTAGGETITAGGLVVTGAPDVTIGTAGSRIVPGATSLSLRNHANSADNVLVADSGATTIRGQLTALAGEVLTSAAGTNVPVSVNGASNLPAQVNIKIQSGRFTWSESGANSQTGTLTFPVAFAGGCLPVVILTVEIGANDDFNINLTAQPTNVSFVWRVFQNTATVITVATAAVHWIAIGF
jgi:hypothetical protein